jgi:hypothetical protein
MAGKNASESNKAGKNETMQGSIVLDIESA